VFGAQELAGPNDLSRQAFDAAIFGAEVFDELGDNVAGGGVIDDGFGDIILTAEAADGPDNGRSVAAEVYVVYGSADLSGQRRSRRGGRASPSAVRRNGHSGSTSPASVSDDGVDDLSWSPGWRTGG
jgi:hypothetical protein